MAIVLHAVNSGKSLEKAKLVADDEMSESLQLMIDTVLSMYDKLASRTLSLMKEKEERKKAEEALTQKSKEVSELKIELKQKIHVAQTQMMNTQKLAAIGELAAGVSHETLNPVNIISVHTQVLQKKRKDDVGIQSFCGKVGKEVKRIQKILGSLLEFSRNGRVELVKGTLKTEIDNVLNLVEEEYKLENINIIRNCLNNVQIKYDPDKIRQIILNLLNNAKYAMPNGGTITIGCKNIKKGDKEFHRFSFTDTGICMNQEVASKIFDPFFTTKPFGEGTGMGLSIAHGIIEEHGGSISFETTEGQGTTFFVDLPHSD
ncbi:MAG: hypothetical protein F3745_05195, partial [Nitrospinae bacterium]|nr:hypothetical protein [Nitrospinota bacterium]